MMWYLNFWGCLDCLHKYHMKVFFFPKFSHAHLNSGIFVCWEHCYYFVNIWNMMDTASALKTCNRKAYYAIMCRVTEQGWLICILHNVYTCLVLQRVMVVIRSKAVFFFFFSNNNFINFFLMFLRFFFFG